MTTDEYMEQHHHLTESIIGLVAIQDSLEGVKEVLDKWRPMLKDIRKKRTITLCEGMNADEISKVLECMNLGEVE